MSSECLRSRALDSHVHGSDAIDSFFPASFAELNENVQFRSVLSADIELFDRHRMTFCVLSATNRRAGGSSLSIVK